MAKNFLDEEPQAKSLSFGEGFRFGFGFAIACLLVLVLLSLVGTAVLAALGRLHG